MSFITSNPYELTCVTKMSLYLSTVNPGSWSASPKISLQFSILSSSSVLRKSYANWILFLKKSLSMISSLFFDKIRTVIWLFLEIKPVPIYLPLVVIISTNDPFSIVSSISTALFLYIHIWPLSNHFSPSSERIILGYFLFIH